MSGQFIKNLLEYMQLSEDLGPLADLKAGNLINVFKQHTRGGQDENKFIKGWGNRLGQNSELRDIGAISGWKDIRKVLKPGDGTYVGFVLYANGKAFGAVNLNGSTLSKPKSDDILVAFDPAGLPEEEVTKQDKEQTRWDYQSGKNVPNGIKNPVRDLATRKAMTNSQWVDDPETGRNIRKEIETGKFRTGVSTNPEQLFKYVDDIVNMLKPAGVQVTCTLIASDSAGAEKSRNRQATRGNGAYTDELEKRQAELGGYYDKHKSLNTALDKFKAGKNMNSFADDDELKDFLRDSINFGQTFVYKNKQYKFIVDDYSKMQKFDIAKLIAGEPVEFRAVFPATDRASASSLYVTYRVGAGGTDVVKIGY